MEGSRFLRNVFFSDLLQEEGKLACMCQGLTCETKNQGRRYLDLGAIQFHCSMWKSAHHGSLCQMLDRTQWWCQFGPIFQIGASALS